MTDYTDLKARLANATERTTPSPWKHERGEGRDYGSFSYRVIGICTHIDSERDARFIAAARQLVPEALAALTALEDDIARLQTAHVQMQRAHDDLAAENARLRGADAVLGAVWEYGMTTLHPHPPEWPMVLNRVRNYFVERDDAEFDARAALTAPTSAD